MKLRQLRNDDDAVSPVIGVILMVAITVILAAVIATFVLGLGEQVSDTAPQASFTFENSSSTDQLDITHAGGATLEGDQVKIQYTDNSSTDQTVKWNSITAGGSTEVSAGDTATVNVSSGTTVRLTWENDQQTDSATLRTYELP